MHCRKQKIEYREPTPKRRLRGKRGSSVPMDVTNTNFFTFACVAAAIRFLVPCATHRGAKRDKGMHGGQEFGNITSTGRDA